MPFLRFTRDRRGYENTFLLHVLHPGDRPRVLYWYRSAPGVQVGRSALDEDAIRTIEEQHPEIEFDWAHILEVGAASPPEVERRPDRPRRKPAPPRAPEPQPRDDTAVSAVPDSESQPSPLAALETNGADEDDFEEPTPAPTAHGLLEQLVGREIATRLRGRFGEISARIRQRAPDEATREIWQARADALDPDTWITADEILTGVSRADELFEQLRRDLLG